MQKLIGFAPDADPTTPGVVTSCTNFIPYETGMTGAPSANTPSDVPALAAACRGAVVAEKLDATRRIIAGTQTKLYELVSGSWTDVSAAGDYAGGSETTWSFTQFGDATIASNGVEKIQRSTSGAFAAVADAPAASIVFSVGAFVMALGTIDATYGTQPDRWWCCASYDDSSWAPSLATLATTARLVSAPGPLLAGGRLGEYAVAYKAKAIYLGQYVGAPTVWDWIQVPGGEAGCVGKDAWCDIGSAHFIVGQDNLYLFDGSRPTPIGAGIIRDWFYSAINPAYSYTIKCKYDRKANRVWIFYPGVGSSTLNKALVYHVLTQQFGTADVNVEAALDYISSGVTIDTLDDVSATIDGLSSFSFDSQYWVSGGRALSIVNTSHQLQTLTGASTSSGFVTGDIGDDDAVTLLRKIRLRFAPGYTPAATCEVSGKFSEGDGLTVGSTSTLANGKFDVLQSARFHRLAFSFTGPARVLGVGVETKPAGMR